MRIIVATLAAVLVAVPAGAQTYPSRPITVVVPFPAGGPSDVVARIVAEHMGKVLGQTMVIENVGGAGGTIGGARVASAARGRLHAARRQHGLARLGAGADAERQIRFAARLRADRLHRACAGRHRRAEGFSRQGSARVSRRT